MASYSTVAGKTTLTLTSKDKINHRAFYFGNGQMVFHWVQEGKTEAWRCDVSMPNPQTILATETQGSDGSQKLSMVLPELYPAACLLQGRMVGTLTAPAVHVDVPWGADIWVFFVKSPWFPLRFELAKPILSVSHKSSQATASLAPLDGGAFGARFNVSGSDFKGVELEVKRSIGPFNSTELVGQSQGTGESFAWKPIVRSFDLLLVFRGSISHGNLIELGKGLGAQVSSGLLGGGAMEGDFVLCDGPSFNYVAVMKGHAGFLDSPQDETGFTLRW